MKAYKLLSIIWILIVSSLLIVIFAGLFLYLETGIYKYGFLAAIVALVLFVIIKVINPLISVENAINQYMRGNISFEDLRELTKNEYISDLLDKIHENIKKGYASDILKKQAEIYYLQRQINPHFLYNSLESIRGNALAMGVDGIAEMTEALATFFRYSIGQKGSMVSLEDEIDNVSNYFIIQQYRFDNRFKLIYEFDEGIDLSKYYLPKLTMQPIVENAIFHGLETKMGEGSITIRIALTEQQVIINVLDDGIGIPEEELEDIHAKLISEQSTDDEQQGGIALINVNKRIKLCFGDEFGLYLSSVINYGTDVELVLPMIGYKEAKNYGSIDY